MIKSIECMGSDYPMGVLQGRLWKESVAAVWQLVQNSHMMDLVRPLLVPKQLHLLHCQKKAETFLKNYLAKFFPDINERIHGIAQGAALPEEALYFLQAMDLELLTKTDTFATASGLAIALAPQKTAGEEVILAANLDQVFPFSDHLVVRKSKPRKGLHSMELTYSFLAGALAGVNEKGLALLTVPAYASDGISLKTVPLSLMIQEVLQSCTTTGDAISKLSSQNRDLGAVILLADAELSLTLFEASRTKYAFRPLKEDVFAVSSKFTLPEMQPHQLASDAAWSTKAWGPFAGQKVHAAADHRVRSALDIAAAQTVFDLENVWQLLAAHGNGQGDETSICRHGSAITTVASIIMSPRQKTFQVSAGTPCTREVQTFGL